MILPKKDDFLEMGHRLFTTCLGTIDVLAFIEEEKTFEDLIGHTLKIEFKGHILNVLDLEILIELKELRKIQETSSDSL